MDFAPSVYEHCAALIGRTPWDVSRDADLLERGQAEAYVLYRHRPVVVGVDIYNLEIEAYGAEIAEPEGTGIPAARAPIRQGLGELAMIEPFDPHRDGRIPMVLAVGARLKRRFPEADVRVPVSGPFSIAAGLVGFETLLCDVLADPLAAAASLCTLAEGQSRLCGAAHDAGLDVAFFESAAAPPLLSPALFRAAELPALMLVMARAASILGHPVPCVIGGDTTPILEALIETGTGYLICPAETDQQAFMRAMEAHPEVMVRVNMSPLLTARGTRRELAAEVDRVLDLARNRENACIGTGALPYETPPESVLFIRDEIKRRGDRGRRAPSPLQSTT